MPVTNNPQPETPPPEKLGALHEKVNAMLGVPLVKKGDARPLPEVADAPTDPTEPKPLERAGPT